MALTVSTFSQNRIGIIGGLINSSASISPEEYSTNKEGFTLGLFFDKALGENVAWSTTGVYSQRGIGLSYDAELTLNYVETDTRLKILMGGRNIQFYIMTGPRISLLVEAIGMIPNLGTGDVSELFEPYDLGYSTGGGLRLGPFFFEATYGGSLVNISADPTFSMKNKGFQLGLGLSIPLGY